MSGCPGASQQDVSVQRTSSELAYHAGVGAAELDEAVRAIDESLFMVFADVDLSEGRPPAFAPQALADLAATLERTALRVNGVATRLSLLGSSAGKAHAHVGQV